MPAAPTEVSATAGNASATLTWTPPAIHGRSGECNRSRRGLNAVQRGDADLSAAHDEVHRPERKGKALATAKRKITAAHCRMGKVTTVKSKSAAKGNVISEKPKPGTRRAKGAKVNLVVSRGNR